MVLVLAAMFLRLSALVNTVSKRFLGLSALGLGVPLPRINTGKDQCSELGILTHTNMIYKVSRLTFQIDQSQ